MRSEAEHLRRRLEVIRRQREVELEDVDPFIWVTPWLGVSENVVERWERDNDQMTDWPDSFYVGAAEEWVDRLKTSGPKEVKSPSGRSTK